MYASAPSPIGQSSVILADIDVVAERREAAYEAARRRVDPSDVLAVVTDRLLASPDDADHPLWPLVQTLVIRKNLNNDTFPESNAGSTVALREYLRVGTL